MHKGDRSGQPWYNEGRYAVFWQHYNSVMQTTHQNALQRAQCIASHTWDSLYNLQRPNDHAVQSPIVLAKPKRRRTRKFSRQRRRMRVSERMSQQSSDTESLYSKMSQGMNIQDPDDREDDEEMEVSDDILNFFEASQKHRQEYKERKLVREEMEKISKKNKAIGNTPKEHPDVIRSREMQQLYGEASPRIHAMETALQLSFDRISTLTRPQYWPNMPLNVIYANE